MSCGEITGSAPSLWILHPFWTMTTPSILISWKPATSNTRGHLMSWAPCKTYHTHIFSLKHHTWTGAILQSTKLKLWGGNWLAEVGYSDWLLGPVKSGKWQGMHAKHLFFNLFKDICWFLFFFLAALCGIQSLSSPTRELSSRTYAPCGESLDS